MNKIPTIFVRNPEDRSEILVEINPGCEWVFSGEGVATRKYDGTCVMLDANSMWWARREVKVGRPFPPNFWPLHFDEITGKHQGWEPIEQSSFAKFHQEAVENFESIFKRGTHELYGPKINGNPEKVDRHLLIAHEDAEVFPDMSTDPYDILYDVESLGAIRGWEGIVWHHKEDERMAKLKYRDIPKALGGPRS